MHMVLCAIPREDTLLISLYNTGKRKLKKCVQNLFFLENKKYYAVWLVDVKYLFKSLEDSMLSTLETLENPVISI